LSATTISSSHIFLASFQLLTENQSHKSKQYASYQHLNPPRHYITRFFTDMQPTTFNKIAYLLFGIMRVTIFGRFLETKINKMS